MSESVPCHILLRRRVTGDFPIGHQTVADPGVYVASFNQHFAVSIDLPNGQRLGLRPHEFVWCTAAGLPRVLPPDPAAAKVWAAIYEDWSGYRDRYNAIARSTPGAELLP